MSTLGQIIKEIKELNDRSSVYGALSSFLQSRYLKKDSGNPMAVLKSKDGSPVSQSSIMDVMEELDEQKAKIDNEITIMESEVIE